MDKQNVDDELVESIRFPSDHPNAAEVTDESTHRGGRGGGVPIRRLTRAGEG